MVLVVLVVLVLVVVVVVAAAVVAVVVVCCCCRYCIFVVLVASTTIALFPVQSLPNMPHTFAVLPCCFFGGGSIPSSTFLFFSVLLSTGAFKEKK